MARNINVAMRESNYISLYNSIPALKDGVHNTVF